MKFADLEIHTSEIDVVDLLETFGNEMLEWEYAREATENSRTTIPAIVILRCLPFKVQISFAGIEDSRTAVYVSNIFPINTEDSLKVADFFFDDFRQFVRGKAIDGVKVIIPL